MSSAPPARSKEQPAPDSKTDTVFEQLIHDLSYEFLVFLWVAAVSMIVGFTAFGGRFSDLYMSLSEPTEASEEVVVVGIGPSALYSWNPDDPTPEVTPRAMLAELVMALDEAGARTIVLDVMLGEESEEDLVLAAAARAHGAVVGGERVDVFLPGQGMKIAVGIQEALTLTDDHAMSGAGLGVQPAHVTIHLEEPVIFSGDMVARGAPLVELYERVVEVPLMPLQPGASPRQGPGRVSARVVHRPSLSLAGAWLHRARKDNRAATLQDLETEVGAACVSSETQSGWGACDGSQLSGLGDFGVSLWDIFELNYLRRESDGRLAPISANRLLKLTRSAFSGASGSVEDQRVGLAKEIAKQEWAERLRDKLVFVGRVDGVGMASADRYPTPYSFPFFNQKDMAGVVIQSQLAEALLTGRRLQHLPRWVEGLATLLAIGLCVWAYRKLSAWRLVVSSVLGGGAFVMFGVLLFRYTNGVVLDLGIPITAGLMTFIVLQVQQRY
jgi:CHASE2 domain-containing sensor protein